jgi:fatty-acyl-CoA synthase
MPAVIGQSILESIGPDGPADPVVFCHFAQGGNETAITYGDLRRESARQASFFQQRGVQPGEVILIVLRHSPELFYSFLGAMLAGAIPSFMPYRTSKQDPDLYWSSHQKLFDRISQGTVLTYGENLPAIRQNIACESWRLLDVSEARDVPTTVVEPLLSSESIAFLQHSSGTTGLKKGVALTHKAVLRQVDSYARALALRPDDRIVSWLPLYHDMGLIACFLLPLVTHTPVVMVDPFEWVMNPGLLFSAITRHRGTLCWQPNFAFHHLCRTVRTSSALDLSSVRAWINCSEPCRAETFHLFARTFAAAGVTPEKLQVCYAMAETVFAVTQTSPGAVPRVLRLEPHALRQGSIISVAEAAPHQALLSTGPTISGLTVCIRDETGRELPADQIGEICVSGHCLFEGYYKIEDETRHKLHGGWYHTGDLGFLYDGELYVTGRKNDLIIVHGRNYYAHELEYIVNRVPGIHAGRAAAVGWLRPEVGSEEVVIIAESAAEAESTTASLIRTVKQTLLDQTGLLVFDVHLVTPGWLIKTTSGKISRTENLNRYLKVRFPAAAD